MVSSIALLKVLWFKEYFASYLDILKYVCVTVIVDGFPCISGEKKVIVVNIVMDQIH